MSETAAVTEVQEVTAEAEVESSGKLAIYEKVADFVKEKTGKRIGKTGGHEIFDIVVAEFFALAAREGTARFNGGYGSLHVRDYKAGERRLPSGQTTAFGERQKMRYEEGVVVKALVRNGGNLDEAVKARGTRKPAEPKAAKEPKPAKAAKEPKPAKAAPAAMKPADGEIDLS